MSQSIRRRSFLALLAASGLVVPGRTAKAADDKDTTPTELRPAVKELAEAIKVTLAGAKPALPLTVAVQPFRGPSTMKSGAGVGLAKLLAEELTAARVNVKEAADVDVVGNFFMITPGEQERAGVRLTIEMQTNKGIKLAFITKNVPGANVAGGNGTSGKTEENPKDATLKEARIQGIAALAAIAAPTVLLSPPTANVGEKTREQELVEAIEKPRVNLVKQSGGTEIQPVSSMETAPYGLQICRREGEEYVPLAAQKERDEGKERAFVQLPLKTAYSVRLFNRTEHDAAVILTIDGLSMYTFNEDKQPYVYFIVPGGKKGQDGVDVPGWYVSNVRCDRFIVAEFPDSAAATVAADPAQLGAITATFSAAWPVEGDPPADEFIPPGIRGTPKSAGTGRGAALAQKLVVVNRVVGRVRAAISVRYKQPE